MNYYKKYLKYKNKYFKLKEQIGNAFKPSKYKFITGTELIEIYNSPYKKYILVKKPSTSFFKAYVPINNTTLEDNIFTFSDETSYNIGELSFKIPYFQYNNYLLSQMKFSENTDINKLFRF